jgi:hypothetical protein
MSAKILEWLNKEIMPRRKRAAPSRLVRVMGRVCWICMLLVLCVFAVWRILLYREVNSRFARIRAAGFPVSGAELNDWCPSVPDRENGALVLTQAFALLRAFPDRRSNEVAEPSILSHTNVWTPATRGLVEAYVQTNARALAKVREALLFPRFRYPVDFGYGPGTPLPHLRGLKDMGLLAALGAALDAEEGRSEEWPEQVNLELRLAETVDGEPIVISYLVRKSIVRMAVKATERSLNRIIPTDEVCKQLQAEFSHASETNLLPLALVGERAMTIPIFRLSWKESQGSTQDNEPDNGPREPQHYSGKPMTFLWLTGFFERDLNFYLETMEKTISLAALPSPASLTLTNYIQSRDEVAEKKMYILSGLVLPLSRLTAVEASTQASIRLAVTALAVERFRLDRGRLPSDLKELTPQFIDAVPTDPFDGAPLRYRRLARGYVIYSIDADGHDDGGREAPERRKSGDNSTYDITFVVER